MARESIATGATGHPTGTPRESRLVVRRTHDPTRITRRFFIDRHVRARVVEKHPVHQCHVLSFTRRLGHVEKHPVHRCMSPARAHDRPGWTRRDGCDCARRRGRFDRETIARARARSRVRVFARCAIRSFGSRFAAAWNRARVRCFDW